MHAERLIAALDHFAAVLPTAVAGLGPDDARWRGEGGTWSILEIAAHLADEEEADFRPRLERTLRNEAEPWPPIDPEGWIVERRSNEGDLDATVERFRAERAASVAWLRGLTDPDWSTAYEHPSFGTIRAGDLLAAWAAHDALHLRQIAKRRYQMIRRDAGAYRTDYAGPWSG